MKIIIFVLFASIFLIGLRFEPTAQIFLNRNMIGENELVEKNDKNSFKCSEGWRITGYFTPIESDYDAKTQMDEIYIQNIGKFSFNRDFLKTVFDESEGFGEGWGKTRFGWYLGNYDSAWHKADAPLDANDSPLKTNSVAVDNLLIPNGSIVKIPDLPGEFGKETFIANDVGVTVHGKHIDVYTGEGKEAERKMYHITFEDKEDLQRVCYRMIEKK